MPKVQMYQVWSESALKQQQNYDFINYGDETTPVVVLEILFIFTWNNVLSLIQTSQYRSINNIVLLFYETTIGKFKVCSSIYFVLDIYTYTIKSTFL